MNFGSQKELLEEQKKINNVNNINSKNQMIKSAKISSLRANQLSRDFCYSLLKSKNEYEKYSDVLNQQMSFDDIYENAFKSCLLKRLAGHYVIVNAFNESVDNYLDQMDINRYYGSLYN